MEAVRMHRKKMLQIVGQRKEMINLIVKFIGSSILSYNMNLLIIKTN